VTIRKTVSISIASQFEVLPVRQKGGA